MAFIFVIKLNYDFFEPIPHSNALHFTLFRLINTPINPFYALERTTNHLNYIKDANIIDATNRISLYI